MFSDLIRPQILFACVVLNLWGILVYLLHTRKNLFQPFTYAMFRQHCIDAEGEELGVRYDKVVGYVPSDVPSKVET
jgi:hypothetical protein